MAAAEGIGEEGSSGGQEVVMGMEDLVREERSNMRANLPEVSLSRKGSGFRRRTWVFVSFCVGFVLVDLVCRVV